MFFENTRNILKTKDYVLTGIFYEAKETKEKYIYYYFLYCSGGNHSIFVAVFLLGRKQYGHTYPRYHAKFRRALF